MPDGVPDVHDFRLEEEDGVPVLSEGELELTPRYLSVDPYLRVAMTGGHPPAINVGDVMTSRGIAEVTASAHKNFKPGDFVMGYMEWRERLVSNGSGIELIELQGLPLRAYLSVLGSTGLSAYFSLKDIGKPERGQTMVVSGAAGAVGSIAGQIGKIYGCRVIGIVGSDDKAGFVVTELGMDAAVNYKSNTDIGAALDRLCSEGVDIYYDNVGGFISDAVISRMRDYGRVVVSGSIVNYHDQEIEMGPRLLPLVVYKKLLIQGFLISDYKDRFQEGRHQLQQWLSEGRLHYRETILKGFDQLPAAFVGLFSGRNEGKMLVEI